VIAFVGVKGRAVRLPPSVANYPAQRPCLSRADVGMNVLVVGEAPPTPRTRFRFGADIVASSLVCRRQRGWDFLRCLSVCTAREAAAWQNGRRRANRIP
jgi:hypothetical protein